MIGSGEHFMFAFGWPHDTVTTTALLLACLCLLPLSRVGAWCRAHEAKTVAVIALCAAGLSAAYHFHYLNGQPRIIDATTYFFQAKNLSLGSFGWTVPGPSASFRGRFITSISEDPGTVAGIFPPGFPALLSLGVLVGHPEWIGPILAAGLVLCTYSLSLALCESRNMALVAAALSALSAALRYHTSETMSHGLSATLTSGALIFTAHLLRERGRYRNYVALGLCLGCLICTRQLTGLIVAGACGIALLSADSARSPKRCFFLVSWVILGATPGLAFLAMQHEFITGSYFQSPQHYYYARADGPANCFRLGWGSGCHYEHADVVAQQGGTGLSTIWMLKNTLHRLHYHMLDIANFEPLSMLAIFGLWVERKRRVGRPLLFVLTLMPLGYAGFYFNGSYPGGGARFFAEMIPLWHVYLAAALVRLSLVRWGLFATLFGFAVHANYGHDQLESPYFGPDSRALRGLASEFDHRNEKALVFFSTAHQFNLAARMSDNLVAARKTRDSREVMVKQASRADAVYDFHPQSGLSRWTPTLSTDPDWIVLEAEFEFPMIDIEGAWGHPEYLPFPCVSGGRALFVHRNDEAASLTIELPAELPRNGRAVVVVVDVGRPEAPCRTVDLGATPMGTTWTLRIDRLGVWTHLDRFQFDIGDGTPKFK